MPDESKLGALPLLLKDGAAVWYNTQPRGVQGDLTELRRALIDRYGPSATDAWKRAADLWQMRQLPSQTTDDFLTSIQQVAQKLDIPPEQTFMVALSGLRSTIRQHVIQHDPKTIADIQKWGRVTETSQDDTTEAAQHLRDTVSELSALKDELKQLKLNSIAAITTQRPRSRSPTPHRVTFANPPAQPANYPVEPPFHHRSPVSYPPPPPSFADHSFSPSTPYPSAASSAYGFHPASTRQPFRHQQMSTWNSSRQFQPSGCSNCGGNHGPQGFCRAKGLTCYNCGKRGHLQSVCRAARGQAYPR